MNIHMQKPKFFILIYSIHIVESQLLSWKASFKLFSGSSVSAKQNIISNYVPVIQFCTLLKTINNIIIAQAIDTLKLISIK